MLVRAVGKHVRERFLRRTYVARVFGLWRYRVPSFTVPEEWCGAEHDSYL